MKISFYKKFQGYCFAVFFVAAAVLLRQYLSAVLMGQLTLVAMLTCAVVLAAWAGGYGPGLFATLLGVLAGVAIIGIEFGDYTRVLEPINIVRLTIFMVTGILVSALSARMHGAAHKAEERQTQLEHEINERQQAQERLEKREALYRAVFDQQFQFMAVLDAEGRVMEVNNLPLAIAGVSHDDVVGKYFWDTPWWDGLEEMKQNWPKRLDEAALADGPVLSEDSFMAKGEQRYADCAITAVRNGEGRVTFFIVQATDQTDRRRAELGLKDSEQRFRLISDTMPQIVWSAQPDGSVDYLNKRWYEFTHMAQGDLSGPHTFIHPDDLELTKIAWEFSMETGEQFEAEYRLRNYNGEYRWFIGRALAIKDAQGNILRWYGTSTDITDIRDAMDKAEAANKAKSEFLANMSHEIRTPMNAVVGLSNILHNHVLPPDKQREFIKTLQLSAQSLMSLINDLLDVTKLQGEEVELERIPFGLPELLEEIISIMSVRAKEKNIELNMVYDKNLTEFMVGDPLRIRQILMNLVSNAVKFTEKGSVNVNVGAKRNEGTGMMDLTFEVADTGIGIPEDKIGNIFSKFSQADTSITRKYGGTGLGLSITKTLVELMGGTIDVVSTPGLGSKFTVRISLATMSPSQSSRQEEEREVATQNLKEEDFFPTHMTLDEFQPTILLAEDYRGNVLVATATIEDCGYNWELAENGREALDMIRQKNYDLVLMDVQMPEMDGISATRAIRDLEKKLGRRHVPIIGVTAYSLKGDREKCMDAGMDDYLAKPFNPLELKGKIQTLLKTASH